MTTLQMELELMNYFKFTQNTIVNGVTEVSQLVNFEADLLILTKNRYATCVEIKVSKSDLKNDIKKKHIERIEKFDYYFKHLKYFYYAVPKELEQEALNQIPKFAGLIIVEEVNHEIWKGYRTRVVRKPTHLFSYQWSERQEKQLLRLGCLRIYNLKNKINLTENKTN